VTDLFGRLRGEQDVPPLSPRIETSVPSFFRKWSQLKPLLDEGGVDPGLSRSIADIDLDRVRRGQMPMSARETMLAMLAAKTQRAITPKPESSGLGGFVSRTFDDLKTVVSSVPKLPGMLVNEAQEIPNLGENVSEALEAGGLREKITALANTPVVRMVPGSFVAGQLAQEGPAGLGQHPLFTVLDVLPLASRAVPASTVANQAEIARLADQAAPSPLRSFYRESVKPRVDTAMTSRGIPTFENMRNRLGVGPGPRFIARKSAQATRQIHTQLSQEIMEIVQRRKDLGITDERLAEISRIGEMGKPAELASLAPHERAYLDMVDEQNTKWAQRGVDSQQLREVGGELYPKAQGAPMARLAERLQQKQFTTGLEDAEAKTLVVLADIQRRQRMVDMVDTDTVGWLKDTLQTRIAEPFPGLLDEAVTRGDTARVTRIASVARQVYQNTRAPVVRAVKALDSEVGADGLFDTRALRTASKALLAGAKRLDDAYSRLGDDALRAEADWMKQQADWLDTQASVHADVKGIPRKERDLNALLDRISTRKENMEAIAADLDEKIAQTVPARFSPLIEERYRAALRVLATERNPQLVGDALATMYENLDAGLYELVPNLTVRDLSSTYREVAQTWTELRDAGYNPRFLHRVDPGQIRTIERPTVYPEAIRSPTQVRARTRDAKAYFQNYEIALSHQAMEWLRKDMTEKVVNDIAGRFGKTRAALVEEYLPLADKMLAQGKGLPGQDVRATIDMLLRRDGWQEWNPNEIVTWTRAQAGVGAAEDVMMPLWAMDTIKRMYPQVHGMRAALDRATNMFRMSILPLSPRWHLYNVLGGQIMLALKTDPTSTLRYFGRAREMMRGEMPVEIAKGVGSTVSAEEWAYHHAVGEQLGKWWQQSRESPLGAVKKVGEKIINKSFEANELVDNFYRSVAYLYAQDQTLTKGMSKQEAHLAGVELANRVLQDWDSMVPFERQIMRAVFPFYGWMRHILSFTLSYPVDHPLRASIISNFARNEYADFGGGLPDKFYGMFYIGQPDEDGNVKAVNLRGSNPFSDVANYATLAGFAGQLNPMIGGVLESMGINMATGKQDLYPNLTYDAQTGRLVARNRNVMESVLFSVLPQTEWLAGQVGLTTDDLRTLKLNNPDAYNARLRSILGLPPLPTEVNVYREAALAELSRDRAARTAFNEALKTGNWQDAMRYPSVRPLLDVIAHLPREQVERFQLPEQMRLTG
jgi:hypothetical protein